MFARCRLGRLLTAATKVINGLLHDLQAWRNKNPAPDSHESRGLLSEGLKFVVLLGRIRDSREIPVFSGMPNDSVKGILACPTYYNRLNRLGAGDIIEFGIIKMFEKNDD
jgi:hypothetical protein